MILTALAAESFRNLAPFRIEPAPGFNIIEGRNGQGKTNLLEAIFLLGAFQSSKGARQQELIAFGQEEARVYGEVLRQEISRKIEVQLGAKGKRVSLDGKTITRLPDSFLHLSVVTFGPDDLELTKGAPESRRRFLDRATYAVWPEYLKDLRLYREALKHRNKILRDAKLGKYEPDPFLIASFEEEMARHAAKIVLRRVRFLEGFLPYFTDAFAKITADELEASVGYQPSGLEQGVAWEADFPALEAAYQKSFARYRRRDLAMGWTRSGPHVDDLDFHIDGRPVRAFASQGQHRAFVLALKIAELNKIEEELGHPPIFLLDDVSSELDEQRNALLMQTLNEGGGQVFITTTDRRWIQVADALLWRVEAGELTRVGPVNWGVDIKRVDAQDPSG